MPLRFGASGSVRASSRHQSACMPPAGPQLLAVDDDRCRRPGGPRSAGLARSEPASGSEKPCTQISPSRMAGRCRCRCSSVPAASRVEAAWWIADERQHQPGRVVGGQLLVQDDLLADRHAAAPLRGPVRHRETGARAAPANQAFWNATNSSSRHAGLCLPPVGRHVVGAPLPHLGSELVQIRLCAVSHPSDPVSNRPVRPCRPDPAGQLVAGRREPEGQPAQRLAVPRQPGQRGLVAEPDGAVQLMGDPEDHLGGLDRGHPQRQRVVESLRPVAPTLHRVYLASILQPGPLDLGVGQLELHALERRQAAGRTAGDPARSAMVRCHGPVQHAEQRPARQDQSPSATSPAAVASSAASSKPVTNAVLRGVPAAVRGGARLRPSVQGHRGPAQVETADRARPVAYRRRRAGRRPRGRAGRQSRSATG